LIIEALQGLKNHEILQDRKKKKSKKPSNNETSYYFL